MVDYSGYQSLPTGETVSMEPAVGGLSTAELAPLTAPSAAPTDERSALLASLPPEYLKGVDAAALDLPTLRNLARSATALSYEQNAAKNGGLYALDNPADYYRAYGTIPISFTGTSGYYDKGVSGPSIDYLTPDANASYTLYSPRSGKVVATGSGAEGLVNLAQQANALNADLGRKADWQLIKTPAGGGAPEVIGSNLFNSDLTTLGKIVATGLPIAASFIPGLNVLGSTLGAMVNAGAAGALGAAMKDQNILKAGLINAATAGLMNAPVLPGGGSLAQSVGKVINKVPVLGDVTQALGKIGSGAASKAVGDEIVVNAARNAAPALASAGAQAVTQGALNTLTQGPAPRRPDYGDKVEPDTAADDPLVVRGIRYGDITAANAARAAAAGASSLTQGPTDNIARPEDEIVVTRRNDPAVTGNLVASTIANSAPSLNAPTTPTATTPTDAKKPDTLDKIIGGLKIAGIVAPLLGGGGGGSGGSSATMPRGLGSANPLYSAKLPTPGVNGAFQVGGMGANSGALPTPAGGDYTRFGMGNAPTRVAPAEIPQYGGVNPPGFNTQTWEWLGPQTSAPAVDFAVLPEPTEEPVKKAMGGYAVGGPGDGRSDEIPAMLSDGEYVMDAETVALLGNGSNKAGAKALDKFRANIRKQKGRKLAQGKFSVNAKRPEAYLSGGR